MSAYVCQSLDFPEPPYPEELICPENNATYNVSFFKIVRKVQVESILWVCSYYLRVLSSLSTFKQFLFHCLGIRDCHRRIAALFHGTWFQTLRKYGEG